ncbi:hypothetical protein QQ045_031658 [Rhodiola kirilowii]
MVALIEMKLGEDRANGIRRKLAFDCGLIVDSQGRARELIIWWKEEIQLLCWGKEEYAQLDFMSKLKCCRGDLITWNRVVFDKVGRRIGEIRKQIEGLKSVFRTEEVANAKAKLQGELDE